MFQFDMAQLTTGEVNETIAVCNTLLLEEPGNLGLEILLRIFSDELCQRAEGRTTGKIDVLIPIGELTPGQLQTVVNLVVAVIRWAYEIGLKGQRPGMIAEFFILLREQILGAAERMHGAYSN
jgi:hypothetical protein